MGRAILAAVIGFVVWTVLFLGGNAAITAISPSSFKADGSANSAGMLVLLLLLSIVYSAVSGVVTSKVAKEKALGACIGLGVALLGVGIAVQLQYWNVLPVWYHLSFLGMLVPAVMAGWKVVGAGNAKKEG